MSNESRITRIPNAQILPELTRLRNALVKNGRQWVREGRITEPERTFRLAVYAQLIDDYKPKEADKTQTALFAISENLKP